jgi:outer membrane protein assembly factor BamB
MVWNFTTYDWYAAVRSTPLYHNGVVYVGSAGTTLYALDAVTGIRKWWFEADSAIVAKPVLFQEKSLIFISSAGTVYSVDL